MKNILLIAALMVMVWSCAKKMTPAKSETPSSNTGSLGSSSTNTVTTPGATPPAVTANGVTAALTPAVGTNPEEVALLAGQSTYNAKCGSCHAHKATIDYNAERWMSIMAVMAPKANLSETERANVTAYVRANSKK